MVFVLNKGMKVKGQLDNSKWNQICLMLQGEYTNIPRDQFDSNNTPFNLLLFL